MTPDDRRRGIRLILWGAVGLVLATAFIVAALIIIGWRGIGERLGL